MTTDRPAPTLHDVAAKAGVSTATVSRSLNFPDKVSAKTRDKVAAAVAALGYSPNFGARVMAAKRTHTIGAIIPTMENAIFARGLQAFQEELRHHGYTMLVASTGYDPATEAEQIRTLIARGADALLLIGHARPPQIYDFLQTQGVPVLITWAHQATKSRASVGFDNFIAMRDMAAEVLAQGHRKLGYISAQIASNDRAERRLAGVKDAMQSAGLDPALLRLRETTYAIDQGAAALADILAGPDRPTAVLCGNDVLAVGALRQAQMMQLRVPDDISITGFDDIELAQVAYPALTTVHVPHQQMGRRAAGMLVDMLRTGVSPASVALPTYIVQRETLGPAPKT